MRKGEWREDSETRQWQKRRKEGRIKRVKVAVERWKKGKQEWKQYDERKQRGISAREVKSCERRGATKARVDAVSERSKNNFAIF